jgi:NADH-quinone oxidoreductase subunit L
MLPDLREQPGLLFVAATLLPLASFLLLLLAGAARNAVRPFRETAGGERLYHLFGGDAPGRLPAYVALAAIAGAFVLSMTGFVLFLADPQPHPAATAEGGEGAGEGHGHAADAAARWQGSLDWIRLRYWYAGAGGAEGDKPEPVDRAAVLRLGYRIDHLGGLMFVMVTFVASLIHLFSVGYMSEELRPVVEDHDVHTEGGHLHRRGRFGRFFLFMSLFCFSMLNLVLADNLFQVFISWELVGICSYLLIGFYFERTSASNAANKAFITNRVGDAGFILGLLILWTYVGSLNFEDIFRQVRAPGGPLAGQVVRADVAAEAAGGARLRLADGGAQAVLFPHDPDGARALNPGGTVEARDNPRPKEYSSIPYWLLTAAGLGIFLGCVGKSAQFPLHVWLPDAMEGPTPVSALIHAATMVAAGVYLVGRVYPLFTPEALLVIAYTGGITLFVAATIAVVVTDIKRVLAYSTVSQLGYMMLALGVGGWVAGLFHLFTHAFFKALLFLGSGSVIYGCHHQQDMRKMGGLFAKMPVTALTMLAGVFAIAGIPLFSGWYSKDSILAQAFGFMLVNRTHVLLFVLPLVTAGLTAFYMFRMWYLTFAGTPRDHHVHEHAHETAWPMTLPLVVLAVCSVAVAWGWPVWDARASWLEHTIHHAQPVSVLAEFGHIPSEGEVYPGQHPKEPAVREAAHEYHDLAGWLALAVVGLGIVFATLLYLYRVLDPEEAVLEFPRLQAFLANRWYFDELYSAAVVRPALAVAGWFKRFDLGVIDGIIHAVARLTVRVSRWDGLVDRYVVDGLVNLTGNVFYRVGAGLREVQTGYLRSYVLFLVLAAAGIFVALTYFVSVVAAG